MLHILVILFLQRLVSTKTFLESTSECRYNNSIYSSSAVVSKEDCSAQCAKYHCSRFVYDSSAKICDLHTDQTVPSVRSETPPSRRLFLSTHTDCNFAGYDFIESAKICIKWYSISKTWWEGRELCRRDGGDILSLDTVEKWNFIVPHLYSCPSSMTWVGMINGSWVNTVPYHNIYGFAPEAIGIGVNDYDHSCVRLRLYSTQKILNEDNCFDVKKVICEIVVN